MLIQHVVRWKELHLTLISRDARRLFFGSLVSLLFFFALELSLTVSASAAQINGVTLVAQQQQAEANWGRAPYFQLRSKTFTNGSILPQSMILNVAALFGPPPEPGCEGGNQSPELEWINAPRGTRSFAIMMFDEDASFVHWAMYNVPATRSSLPQGAGTLSSPYGQQVFNDFANDFQTFAEGAVTQRYDGPCPPSTFQHRYVITVYAIDGVVTLPAPPQLTSLIHLPTGATLFQTLLLGRYHILASASIFGLYGLPAGPSQNAMVRRRAP
ncbi:MAG: YbhB/YbcL family Raf kinase inhibitor-like protein [Candidatus Velthaea sp.]